MEIKDWDLGSDDEQQTSGQAPRGTPAKIDLDALHNDYMASEENTTKIGQHPKGHITYHEGRHGDTEWSLAPALPKALKEIERHLGHPMLLGGGPHCGRGVTSVSGNAPGIREDDDGARARSKNRLTLHET